MPNPDRRAAQARRAAAVGLPAYDARLEWACGLCGRVVSLINGGKKAHKRKCPVRREREAARLHGNAEHPANNHNAGASASAPGIRALSPSSVDGNSSGMDTDPDDLSEEGSDSSDTDLGNDAAASLLSFVGAQARAHLPTVQPTVSRPRTPSPSLDTTLPVPETALNAGAVPSLDEIPLLEVGQMFVVPHPYSGQKPYMTVSPFMQPSRPGEVPPVRLDPHTGSTQLLENVLPPHHPFKSEADFRQAELFVMDNCTDKHINKQLAICAEKHKSKEPNARAPPEGFKSAKEMHQLLRSSLQFDAAGEFQTDVLTVPFRGQPRKYKVRWRSISKAVESVIQDPIINPLLHLYPERCYVRHFDGSARNMRVWREEWDGDDWWEYQTIIGPGGVALFITVYSDCAIVSSFGNSKKVWGVWAWLGAVPKSARSIKGKGRAILVGLLPWDIGEQGDNDAELALHRVVVYHQAMMLILQCLRLDARYGIYFEHGKIMYKGHTLLSIASMDYEEMIKAALILGVQSGFPCPICLVPSDQLLDVTHTWPMRTTKDATRLIKQASKLGKTARAKKLREQSIRDVDSAFVYAMHPKMSIYRIFATDPCHMAGGLTGGHDFPWTLKYLSPASLAEVDHNFAQLPPCPGIHHFPRGPTTLKRLSWEEHKTIARYFIPCSQGLYPAHEAEILQYKRQVGIIVLLYEFDVQTDATFEMFEACKLKLAAAAKVLSELGIGADYNWPKMHLILRHAVPGMRGKGPTDNYQTSFGEALHPPHKVDYRRSNKHIGWEDQLLRNTQERNAVLKIRENLDHAREQPTGQAFGPEDFRVRLASPQKRISVSHALRSLSVQLNQHSLETALHRFILNSVDRDVSQNIILDQSITPCFSLRVHYVCQVSAAVKEDIVHVHPNWYDTGPRRDWVLVQVGSARLAFAQLLYPFWFKWKGVEYNIALARIHYRFKRSRLSGYIEILDAGCYEFMLVDSVIRRADVVPPTRTRSKRVVQDLHNDMFLRLSHID
ncbi:hypothetical protein PENSPDRAFT_734188 [Peniophora sp. CONT]|nr:hypothetical protein PENSPDRAFT_734188 [Peniophora sp. CONT]